LKEKPPDSTDSHFVFGDFAVSILIKLGDGVACALDLGDGNFPVSISIQHLK
jgi:hypothetical protein